MPPVVFEPTISTGERAPTYALDRAATGIGKIMYVYTFTYLCSASGGVSVYTVIPVTDRWGTKQNTFF
jgi:hypothetical protein